MSHFSIYCIEGGIAAGKSTLEEKLKLELPPILSQDNIITHFIDEPLEEWKNVGGHNILEAFYKNKERWGFTFQIEAFTSRVSSVEKKMAQIMEDDISNNHHVFILERSWINDREVFGHLLHEDGKISEMEWAVYTKLHQWLVKKAPSITSMIYLDTSPEECVRRKNLRNREEEKTTPDDYISRIAQRYHDIMDNTKDHIIKGDFDVNTLSIVHDIARIIRVAERAVSISVCKS